MTTMTQELGSRSWAGDRLRLGQANVGFWVLASVLVLGTAPLGEGGSLAGGMAGWGAVVGLYILAQAPFDVVGGYLLPVVHGRREPGFGAWARRWGRGVAVHGASVVLIGWTILGVAGTGGTAAGAAVSLGAGAALVALQRPLATWLSDLRPAPVDGPTAERLEAVGIAADRVRVVDASDPGFVGGWVGPRGLETLWLPTRWTRTLAPAVLEVALLRRRLALESGSRALGVLAALVFNAVGLGLVVALMPGAALTSAAGLVATSAGCTLWSFLGLLTLPTLSRGAVSWLDRGVAASTDRASVVEAIAVLDRDQEDERDRAEWVETIFHPVPSPASREAALGRPAKAGPVAWRVTRMALFTSWAQLSLLGRAVHCNAGRPELWVLLPGD